MPHPVEDLDGFQNCFDQQNMAEMMWCMLSGPGLKREKMFTCLWEYQLWELQSVTEASVTSFGSFRQCNKSDYNVGETMWRGPQGKWTGRIHLSLVFYLSLPRCHASQVAQQATGLRTPPANAGHAGNVSLIPGSRRSPRGGKGNPQYSHLENSMDRGAWRVTIHGVTKSWTNISLLCFSQSPWVHRKKKILLVRINSVFYLSNLQSPVPVQKSFLELLISTAKISC